MKKLYYILESILIFLFLIGYGGILGFLIPPITAPLGCSFYAASLLVLTFFPFKWEGSSKIVAMLVATLINYILIYLFASDYYLCFFCK